MNNLEVKKGNCFRCEEEKWIAPLEIMLPLKNGEEADVVWSCKPCLVYVRENSISREGINKQIEEIKSKGIDASELGFDLDEFKKQTNSVNMELVSDQAKKNILEAEAKLEVQEIMDRV